MLMKKIFLIAFVLMSLVFVKDVSAFCCRDPGTSQWKCYGTGYCCNDYWQSTPCTYSAIFQSGIPSGTTWGVTVGGTRYTSTTSSLTVSGLSGSVAYTYDSTVSGASGTRYICNSGCSGSVSSSTTVTASYGTQYYLTMQAGSGGTVSPSSNWYNAGSSVSISATPNSGYSFSQWTCSSSGCACYSGTNNPATVTMNCPITETANFNIFVTVTSSPVTGPGFVTIDSVSYSTPQTFSWIPSSTHIISANSPVSCGSGCQYIYTSWSDGGARTHTISPSTPGTYTANFKKQYYLTLQVDPTGGGTTSPVVGSYWYDSGSFVPIQATSLGSCMFSSWSGTGTVSYSGTNNPSSVTMNSPINEIANFDCGTANSINFTGYLNYSNGQPVKNSLIRFTLRNNTLSYEKSSVDQTDQYGHFFVKIVNIPDVIINSNLDISIYVVGEVEALYDCWYNHTSEKCCSLPLTGPC
jgi:hypothetical protein